MHWIFVGIAIGIGLMLAPWAIIAGVWIFCFILLSSPFIGLAIWLENPWLLVFIAPLAIWYVIETFRGDETA